VGEYLDLLEQQQKNKKKSDEKAKEEKLKEEREKGFNVYLSGANQQRMKEKVKNDDKDQMAQNARKSRRNWASPKVPNAPEHYQNPVLLIIRLTLFLSLV
jgi:hypothetical protein